MLDYLHDAVTLAVVVIALWAVVSPCVPTGILGTAGAATVGIAAVWSLDYWMPATTVVDTMLGGFALIGCQCAWCVFANRKKAR